MVLSELHQWISDPTQLNSETLFKLREWMVKYPYFQTIRLLYIQNLAILNSTLLAEELQQAALFLPDRSVLFRLLEGERFRLSPIVRENEPVSMGEEETRTSSLIDTFLTVYKEEKEREVIVPVNLSFDYASVLKEQSEIDETESPCEMKGQHLIDSFIASDDFEIQLLPQSSLRESLDILSHPEGEEVEQPAVVEEVEDESCFTETLARIYVKQGRYVKALEIIKKLNLKYPEKNSYFADQIRFLEKLIINTKSE